MLCADVLASTASILNLSVISLDRKAGGGGRDSHISSENLIFGPLLQPKNPPEFLFKGCREIWPNDFDFYF